MSRRSRNPDVRDFAYGYQHITQRKVIKKIKEANTSYGKAGNSWTKLNTESLRYKR